MALIGPEDLPQPSLNLPGGESPSGSYFWMDSYDSAHDSQGLASRLFLWEVRLYRGLLCKPNGTTGKSLVCGNEGNLTCYSVCTLLPYVLQVTFNNHGLNVVVCIITFLAGDYIRKRPFGSILTSLGATVFLMGLPWLFVLTTQSNWMPSKVGEIFKNCAPYSRYLIVIYVCHCTVVSSQSSSKLMNVLELYVLCEFGSLFSLCRLQQGFEIRDLPFLIFCNKAKGVELYFVPQ